MPCTSENPPRACAERKEIGDWAGIHPYTPEVIYDPAQPGAARRPRCSRARRTGGGVRAQGAGYSLSRAAVADRVLIRTTALNKFLGAPRTRRTATRACRRRTAT